VGRVGAGVGSVGAGVGTVGLRVGAVGLRVGAVGLRVGAVGLRVGAVGCGVGGAEQASWTLSPLSPIETANRYVPAVMLVLVKAFPELTPFFLKPRVPAVRFSMTVMVSPLL